MDEQNYLLAGKVADFEDGSIQACAVNGVAICNIAGKLHAVSDFCTHEAVSLSGGYGVVYEGVIICMLHTSVFEPESGTSTQGPAYDPLSVYDVKVEGDDVYVSKDKKNA